MGCKEIGVECVRKLEDICCDENSKVWQKTAKIVAKTDLWQKLKSYYHNDNNTNIEIHVGETVFKCHLLVLQSFSDLFKKYSKHESFIKLSNNAVAPRSFQMIYNWILLSKTVQRHEFVPLFLAAKYLEIKPLEKQCWDYVEKTFEEDEAFLLYLEAKQFNFIVLENMMLQRINKFFLTIVCSKDFLLMEINDVVCLLELNNIGVNAEIDILYAASRWLLYDWDNREHHLTAVMKTVRFGMLFPCKIVEFRTNNNVTDLKRILDHPVMQEMLEVGLYYCTYKQFFQEDDACDQFCAFLTRFKLKREYNRQQIEDHHYRTKSHSYEEFIEYLHYIQKNVLNHWKTVSIQK
ncbi:unnamed protein product [Diamesa serratosioi]